MEGFDILHFATHAVVDEANEGLTALALAPGEGEDGFLQPGELAQLRLNAALVVLSACRTAGGVVVRGEGLLGLAAPFLEAGARAVLATQWDVDDRAAGELTGSFYRAMANGLPASEALRAAKVEALRAGAPASEWAAFTLVGDPLAYVRLEPPRRRQQLALLIVAVVLAAGGLAAARRWRRAGVRARSGR